MADEPVAPVNPAEPTEAPAVTPEQTQATSAQTPPPAPAGPSVDDVMARISKLEDDLAQTRQENAQVRHDNDLLRNLVGEKPVQGQPQYGQPPQAPDSSPVTDEEWVVNPAAAYRKQREWEATRDKERSEREQATRYVETARTNFTIGRSSALSKNSTLYKGIEKDVEGWIFEALKSRAIPPEAVAHPEIWEQTAINVRIQKGERNLEKYFSPTPQATAPVYTEVPTPHEPPKDAIKLTPEELAVGRELGLSEEQLIATKKLGVGG